MRSIGSMILVLGVVFLFLSPAHAAELSERDIELLAAEFERMFQPLFGQRADRPTFKKHPGDVYSLSYELDREQLERVRAYSGSAKLLNTLAGGHQVSDPSDNSTLINATLSNLVSAYNFWWAYVNEGNAVSRKTIVKITGPGGYNEGVNQRLDYDGGVIGFFVFSPDVPFSEIGLYKHNTNIKKAGKANYKFWAQ